MIIKQVTTRFVYCVDVWNGTEWEAQGETDKTFDDAIDLAKSLWITGNEVKIFAWSNEDGYIMVAHYG